MSTLGFFRVVGSALSGAVDRAQLQLRGLGQDGDNSGSEPIDDAVHVQPLGLFARAVVARSLRAIGWRDGDDVHVLALWNKSIAQDPSPDAGETRVYSVGAPKVCLRVGPVNIELRVNVTGEVRLAADAADYAGKEVARKDDRVRTKLYAKMSGEVLPGDRRVIAMFAQASDGSWVQIDYGTSDPGALSGTYGYGTIYEGAAKVKA
jgi:hypothetical protein